MPLTCRHLILRWTRAALLMVLPATSAVAQVLTVAVDSSLGAVMEVVARDFEAAHSGLSVKLLPGASGALLEKIGQGTAADLLISADAQTAALGVQRRVLLPDLRSAVASNTLVLVVPGSSKLPLQRLSDLALPEVVRVAMGRESSVPAGRYAREAIDAQRLWPSLQGKVVIASDGREVLDWVANAEAEAGFVFATDVAQAAERVRVVETLPTVTPIRYLAHVVASTRYAAPARSFVDHLRSDAARSVFKRFGFGLP